MFSTLKRKLYHTDGHYVCLKYVRLKYDTVISKPILQ